jgi:hypothetical protein
LNINYQLEINRSGKFAHITEKVILSHRHLEEEVLE